MGHSLPISVNELPGIRTGMLRRKLVYLDNACLTPTPREVGQAVAEYYARPPGCLLRSDTQPGRELDLLVREAREAVRGFIGAQFSDEIVFTPNTTYAINLLSGALAGREGRVLVSDAEHNSNRLPWLRHGIAELPWPPGTDFPMEAYRELLRTGIKLVSLASVSNATGAGLPVREVVREAHACGIPVHIDAAQQAPHLDIDVENDLPDALSFSLHKAYGPSGLGVLYLRRQLQAELTPELAGGGTVDDHHGDTSTPTRGPARFEFGLQNYAAQSAVVANMGFLKRFSAEAVRAHFLRLNTRLRDYLRELPGIRFLGPESPGAASHVCNFSLDGVDSKRLGELLDRVGNVQVRAGRMCAHHYYHRYALPPSVRVSFGYHNTEAEVDALGKLIPSLLRHYLG